ncbi:hypothetical protein ACFXPT_39220 [Streptomyces goshikiensis]|uniref:hypothetical protein n=1 Tax=Streptomyces goshikiensis TaxID=1942 RepID=UPI00368DAD62
MIRKIAVFRGRALAIPKMVAVELVAHHQHEVELNLKAAHNTLGALTDRFRMPSCGDVSGSWNNPFNHGLRGDDTVWNGLGMHGSSCLVTSTL